MHREPVLTRPLLLGLLCVALVLGLALADRFAPRTVDDLLATLADGDHEGSERRAVLRDLAARGEAATERRLWLCGLMAAVALDDEPAFRRAAPDPKVPPLSPGDVAMFDTASLGDEVLASLLAAVAAELAPDPALARQRYERVVASSRLFHLRLPAKLAQEGLARLR
jgi:hypothetical protein